MCTHPVKSKDVDMPAGPLHVSEVDISFKGLIFSVLAVANALELLKKHNTTQDMTEKVEGILYM
jgi:hypothetical protein